MKKIISLCLALALCVGMCLAFASCNSEADYTVGVCQLMRHESLDLATNGFKAGLEAELAKAGKTVDIDVQVAGETPYCSTVINALVAKDVDLIMANATPALSAAANATSSIPVLGTSVTDYEDTFSGSIPANVSGTSDAVPFSEQAQMMIDTLKLVEGDKVGVIYCSNESNSMLQYQAVKSCFESQGIIVNAYTFAETTDFNTVVTAAANESKAIYVPSDNTVANNDSTLGDICNGKNVPVYTSYPSAISYASLAINYYDLGYATGVMAAQVLLGQKSVTEIEIQTLEPEIVYNNELCEKFGVTVPQE